ncbi:NAD(P)-binding protein, partial [Acinetobacter baumannii]|uniref:NAD(P)-binding protein n=1 Tax=Acinetobacter baumannii TaxID=470 RepID=UPI001CB8062E
MTAQMKTNASAKKAVNSPSHIYDTFIVGAGISGIAAAIRLDQVGYTNYKIIEKAGRVGGTWRENTYPGCGCDVPSALYSYSFAPSAKWSHLFARQPEILSYLEDVSNEFNITSKIEFNNERHCCKVSDEAAFCLIQRPYISKTLLTRRISPRGS